MNEPGAAQIDLIRRYSRTLRELHAEARRLNGPRIGARARRSEAGNVTMTPVARRSDVEAGRSASTPAPAV